MSGSCLINLRWRIQNVCQISEVCNRQVTSDEILEVHRRAHLDVVQGSGAGDSCLCDSQFLCIWCVCLRSGPKDHSVVCLAKKVPPLFSDVYCGANWCVGCACVLF